MPPPSTAEAVTAPRPYFLLCRHALRWRILSPSPLTARPSAPFTVWGSRRTGWRGVPQRGGPGAGATMAGNGAYRPSTPSAAPAAVPGAIAASSDQDRTKGQVRKTTAGGGRRDRAARHGRDN